MSALARELQSLSPSAIIELYVLDMTNLPSGDVLRFHAGINGAQGPIVWRGETYIPMPIEAEGFETTAEGLLPRPKLRVANVDGMFSAETRENDDLLMCKLIRKRTHVKFLDAVNFPDGGNPTAANEHYPDQVYFIDRKVSEDNYMIEWELASAFDVEKVRLPFRQILQNTCPWRYRGPECGYNKATYYDYEDNPVWDVKLDQCSKRMSSCAKRFGTNAILPFGGFPGARRYDQ